MDYIESLIYFQKQIKVMSLKFWLGIALYILLLISIIFGSVVIYERYGIDLRNPTLFATVLLIFLFLILIGYRGNKRLNKNEMRRAIAGSMIVAMFAILFFSVQLNKDVLTFFLGVISTVIGFYFGYRKIESEKEHFKEIPTKEEIESLIEILKEGNFKNREIINEVLMRIFRFWRDLDEETRNKALELMKVIEKN